ncbi:putative bifunctional diguanylate cyclase/phosphodiesterase [Methylomarinum vadi]|uniref:putative bifunctional diguanylate cyclase/phosphodiesterase n=1 Tax=Methylomarinum vadi TaxID=438855 RepID=UPI0009FFBBD0|nr:EAL domain-containing protein [Methylomarinum vadi]
MQSGQSAQHARSQIKAELVAHLYRNAPLSYAFTILNGFLLAFLQRAVISLEILSTWFMLLLVITLIRWALVVAYNNNYFKKLDVDDWNTLYLWGTGFAGCVWASAAKYLFPPNNIDHQLFVVFVLAGMTAASVSVLAARMKAFFFFTAPILITLSLQIYLFGSTLSSPMAMMIILYLIGLSVAARETHRTIMTSLELRFDNRMLMKEIRDRQLAEEALHQQKERLQITFSAMGEGVIITDSNGLIEYINPAAEKISGWLNSDVIHKKTEEIFTYFNEETGNQQLPAILNSLMNPACSRQNHLLRTKNGEHRLIEEIATPLMDRSGSIIVGAVAIIRDITQANEYSRQLAFQASHDALTRLPNRSLLCDRLEHAISKAKRTNCMVAVLFMDLDRFKQINDSLGHAAGDELLCGVAQQIEASVREGDTVARLGGDEFVVVLEDIQDLSHVTSVAQKIINHLAHPLTIENQEITANLSIGIAVYPRDGPDVETLLKHADTAMYQTKKFGHEKIQFYFAEMSTQAVERLKLEQQLQHAVIRNELELFYQPRVNIKKRKIVGFEALVRWRMSPNILVPPSEFIHIAEETGTILKIGEWVLFHACQQARRWHISGNPDLHIAVNLSARQIRSPNIVELVANMLQQTQLKPETLELEITESIFLHDLDHAIATLRKLKALGIKLAIDDFGTGYSSLTYIKRFPIDILKIDRSFVQDLDNDLINSAIVPTIITLAHNLNLEVIAEGVEDEMQQKYLNDLGCIDYQGFLFSKPLPEPEATELLKSDDALFNNFNAS